MSNYKEPYEDWSIGKITLVCFAVVAVSLLALAGACELILLLGS